MTLAPEQEIDRLLPAGDRLDGQGAHLGTIKAVPGDKTVEICAC